MFKMFNSGNDDIDLIDLFFLIALLYAGYMIICRKTEFLNDIFYSARESWSRNPTNPIIENLKDSIRRVVPEVDELQVREGNKSYTLDKEKIYLCLKDSNGKKYDINDPVHKNMLVYVLLHELAHVLNKQDVGHTAAFHKKFDDVLKMAEQRGIYNPNLPLIKNYCE
jgi:hypothetical protein|tara:strand:- start:838 stop:1338 length:501 start_codon:yes stop_codon:yes gene_type:complete